jgi:hypothetical protein
MFGRTLGGYLQHCCADLDHDAGVVGELGVKLPEIEVLGGKKDEKAEVGGGCWMMEERRGKLTRG